jgi:hypothetical protein
MLFTGRIEELSGSDTAEKVIFQVEISGTEGIDALEMVDQGSMGVLPLQWL